MHRQEVFRAAEPDGVLLPPVNVPPGVLLLLDDDDDAVAIARDADDDAENLFMVVGDRRVSLCPTRKIVDLRI